MESRSGDVPRTREEDITMSHAGQRGDDMPIAHAREGMDVVDDAGHKVGEIAMVRLGDPDAATLAGQEDPDDDHGAIDDIVSVFGGSDEPKVPPSMRARMYHDGFITIGGGLLGDDRYALAHQIAAVSGHTVRLNVNADELAREGAEH